MTRQPQDSSSTSLGHHELSTAMMSTSAEPSSSSDVEQGTALSQDQQLEEVVLDEHPDPVADKSPVDVVPAITTTQPWTHAWFHITVSVLSAPAAASLSYAFAYLTWPGAIVLLLYATVTSYSSGRMLIHVQEPSTMSTYSDVANAIMTERHQFTNFANRYVRPFQALVFVQTSIWTILVTGTAMANLDDELSPSHQQILSNSTWVIIAGICYFGIALIPSLDKMWALSVIGAVCGVVACVFLVIGTILAILNGSRNTISFGRPPDNTNLTYAFGILAAFGDIALSYGGHSVLPDLQFSLHEPDTKKAHTSMNKALTAAYGLIAPSYTIVGVMGYAAFGSTVQPYLVDSLIDNYNGSYQAFLIALNFCIVINQFFEGSIYIQAAFTLMGDIFPRLRYRNNKEKRNRVGGVIPLLARVFYVGFCTFVSIAIPFFGDLTALTGSLGFVPMTFVFPFVFWLYSEGDDKTSISNWKRYLVWAIIVTFVLMGIGGATAAIYFIVQQSETFQFFG